MSFCNNNIIDIASDRGAIYLGVWDTLNVRQQQFDVSAWLDAYGDDGVLTVLNQRRTDELPYEVADVTLENGVATWTFDETDTAVVGEGKAALVYIRAGETIARTVPFPTYTAPTIGMTGAEPPDPWEAWYTRILQESAAAQQAATDAGAAQTAAETAATAAETAQGKAERDADRAENQATRAVNAAADARDARAAAIAAQTAAETAKGKAEDAQGLAEAAELAAQNARIAAETAQGKAEAAQTAAETAQGKAEDAQEAAEAAAAAAEAHKYDAFATDGSAGVIGFRTLLGADGIPVKTATVTQTAGTPTTWTLRKTKKNLFDNANVVLVSGRYVSSTGDIASETIYSYTQTYIPVMPSTTYTLRGFSDTLSITGAYVRAIYYSATANAEGKKTFLSRGTSVQASSVGNLTFTTPSDCYFIRFNFPSTLVGDNNRTKVRVQLENGDTMTDKEAYSATDYEVEITENDAPVAVDGVTTDKGENNFILFKSGTLITDTAPGASAEMDLTVRLDPTLAFDSLRG